MRPVHWSDGMFNTKYTGERIVHKDCIINGLWTDEMAEQEADRINNLEISEYKEYNCSSLQRPGEDLKINE